MKKYSLISLMLLFLSFGFTFAQKAEISFKEKNHDFGKILEKDGRATHLFKFTNTGSSVLVINKVRASCGCTTPTWTKKPIEPGQSGVITVVYNAAGRPNAFKKSIIVYSNAKKEQVILTIKGFVVPKIKSKHQNLPVMMDDLRLSTKVVQMGNIKKGESRTRSIEILNVGKKKIKPTVFNLPSYITVKVTKKELVPNEKARIIFTFNSKQTVKWGNINQEIFIALNNKRVYNEKYKIMLFENIVEDFSTMTLDQKRKAPILELSSRRIDFGTIKSSKKKTIKIKISNKGINPLLIRRILNDNKDLSVKSGKKAIKSGKSTNLEIELNTKNMDAGEYKKNFTIQTNDPTNSVVMLIVNWNIKQ